MLNDMIALPYMTGQNIQAYISKCTLPKLCLMLDISPRTVYNYLNKDKLPRTVQFSLLLAELINGNIRNKSITGAMLKNKMQVLDWSTNEMALAVGKSRDSIDDYLRNGHKLIPLDMAISIDYLIFQKDVLIKYKIQK